MQHGKINESEQTASRNELYPVFLKASQLNFLIVGGGNVALEKLSFLLKSSPNVNVELVAENFDAALVKLAEKHSVPLRVKTYSAKDVLGRQIVIAATNNEIVNQQIVLDAKLENCLVNVADSPALCDFYLGGVVTRGDLKIAISTNGKSPTVAKRMRQFFETVIPDNSDELINNLNTYRASISGDFKRKVDLLNIATKELIG